MRNLPNRNSGFRDDWENNFDKHVNRGFKLAVASSIIPAVASLVFLIVLIWGIVQLVQWVTAK